MANKQTLYSDIHLNDSSIAQALNYIEDRWDSLERYNPDDKGTLVGLPYPYIVPSAHSGSGFSFDEMYYWDSFFIAQALLMTNKEDLASGMLENLLYMAKRFDIIPNGNRYYFTGRSQPPLLTTYVLDVFKTTEDLIWLQDSMAVAEYEYTTVWMGSQQPNWRNVFHGLSRYYDINLVNSLAEAESGWDMTTRFNDKCLEYIPIDLNSLLYKYEIDFAEASELQGDQATADAWKDRASERAETINQYLWDDKNKFFFDYNYEKNHFSSVWSLASFYPLWAGLASDEQAKHLVKHLEKFMDKGGLLTTLPTKNKGGDHKHQWAHPNGWAPLHWIVVKGLERYGYNDLAKNIGQKWLETNTDYYERHGVFREAYNVANPASAPEAGLYPPQIGFGWTNAVYINFAIDYTDIGKEWQSNNNGKPSTIRRILRKLKRILHKKLTP